MVFDQKRTRGLSVTLAGDQKIAVVKFLDRSLNFHISENLREDLKKTIVEKSGEGCQGVILDLSEVGVIDSCGVGIRLCVHNPQRTAACMATTINAPANRSVEWLGFIGCAGMCSIHRRKVRRYGKEFFHSPESAQRRV